MFTQNIIAAGALLSVVAAVPLNNNNNNNNNNHQQKRDVVWVTATEEDVVTMQMTKTVWLEPGETPPAPGYHSHFGHHHHHHSKFTSHILSTVTVPAPSPPVAPTESSSNYVAPASYSAPSSSSSSEYVAPTTSEYVAPTTSSTSVYVAPTTSPTSVYVASTTPSSTYVAPSSTSVYSAPPAPSSSSPPPSGGSGLTGMAAPGTSYTGDLTYYADGLGACGTTSTPDQSIVAISEVIFDAYNTGNPNDNPLCGKTVTITSGSGSKHTATVVDRCVGCKQEDLDLSSGFFVNFAPLAVGRLTGVEWCFED